MFASVLSQQPRREYRFPEAVLAGWADDGGMLWPTAVPKLSGDTLRAWASLSYPQLCAAILKLFVAPDEPEMTPADIDAITASAVATFGSKQVVEFQALQLSADSPHLLVAELWHGPTLAFKDLGMSVLGHVLSHLLQRCLLYTSPSPRDS